MKLRDIMSSPVLTVYRGDPASDALARMSEARVRHAIVVTGSDVVGVVSDRDLGGHNGGLARRGHTVEDMMRPAPVVASPDTPLASAALFLREHGIGCVPVLERGRLVGIVTRGDLLGALADGRRRRRSLSGTVRELPANEERPSATLATQKETLRW